jgi:branched-subunit amino acid aminotransferase/4-amino-4-deoxychorismate lyase
MNQDTISFPSSIHASLVTGYSVYTTFTVDNFKVKSFIEHIKRLQNNAKILFDLDLNESFIIEKIKSHVMNIKEKKFILRVALYPINFSISYPSKINDVEVVFSKRDYVEAMKPVSLICTEMIRPLAHLKTNSLFQSFQARTNAQKNGFDDCLFYYDDIITEGPTWNIFFGSGKNLFFPDPKHKTFLEGFTQKILLKYLDKNFIINHKNIYTKDIENFEYAFITSSGVGVLPVLSINKKLFHQNLFSTVKDIYENIPNEDIF